MRTARERFDSLALGVLSDLDRRWQHRLGLVEYAVEDIPELPQDWAQTTVPLAALVRSASSTRLVLFRRPIERRCATRADLEAMLLTVAAEQFAELLGIPAEDVHPLYRKPD